MCTQVSYDGFRSKVGDNCNCPRQLWLHLTADLLFSWQVGLCFSLSGNYKIAYKDDDGEETEIGTEHDFKEAVQYFSEDDGAVSDAASPGSSSSVARIIMKVFVLLEYDGPNLSDATSYTGSLLSYGSEFEGSDWASVKRDSHPSGADHDAFHDDPRFRYLPSRRHDPSLAHRRLSNASSAMSSARRASRFYSHGFYYRRNGLGQEQSNELDEDEDDWDSFSSSSDRTSASTPETLAEASSSGDETAEWSDGQRTEYSDRRRKIVSELSSTSTRPVSSSNSLQDSENVDDRLISRLSSTSLSEFSFAHLDSDGTVSDDAKRLRHSSRDSTFSQLSLVPDEFLTCSACNSVMDNASVVWWQIYIYS
jgi:hypothetical protein